MRPVVKTKVQNFRLSEPQEARFKQLIGWKGYFSWSEVIIGGLLALERERDRERENPPRLLDLVDLVDQPAAAPPPAELLILKTPEQVAEKLAALPKKSAARKTRPAATSAASKNKSDTRPAKKGGKKGPPSKGRKAKA